MRPLDDAIHLNRGLAALLVEKTMEKVVYPRHLADCRAAQHYFVSMSFFNRSYVQNLKQRPQRLSPSPSCKSFPYPSLSSNTVSWSRGGLGLDFKPKEIWTILPMPINSLLAFEKVIKQIKSARGRSTMIIWFARICGTHGMVVGTFCTAFRWRSCVLDVSRPAIFKKKNWQK